MDTEQFERMTDAELTQWIADTWRRRSLLSTALAALASRDGWKYDRIALHTGVPRTTAHRRALTHWPKKG